ncbi:dipeptide epimerase [Hydrogenimonas sp.]
MKIIPETYRLTTVHLPLENPFVTALRRVDAAVAVRLELFDESGPCGIGEAPPTVAITGESMEDIRNSLQNVLLPELLHKPLTMEEAQRLLHDACPDRTSAKACLDIALHDLFAQKAGIPLWRYLGTEEPSGVETAVTVSLEAPETMEERTRDFWRKGLKTLKVKVGGKDGKDFQRIRAVREAAPDATILVDANQAWREKEALHLIDAIAPLGIELIEQPLKADDLEGMRRLTAESPIPILADESAFTLAQVREVVETGAAHMVNVKLMKCGGLAKAKEILRWCENNDVGCMMGSMLETPVSIEAATQLAMAYPETIRYTDLDSPLLYARTSR